MVQFGGPMLLRQTAQLGIKIDRIFLQIIEHIKNGGTLFNPGKNETIGQQLGDILALGQDRRRIGVGIDAAADRVTRIGRAQKRQDQVRSRRNAPCVEGLAEIGRLSFDATQGHNIDQAAETDCRIHQEPADRYLGAFEFALEHIVEEEGRLLHVVEHVMHRSPGVIRYNRDIGFGHWPKQQVIDEQIEGERLAIERLQRVIGLFKRDARRGVGGRRRASCK
ncbi:MAG TPA: hypothetical protein VM782_18515 [Stellaceae bacterium]|nr:hypothetical protein [Stellaceae bacterium]